jgi:hypothetical protein
MPRLVPFRLAAACALAIAIVLSSVAVAAAKGPVAELRVVGSGGKVLVEKSFGVGSTSVKASPSAKCFGPGTGGSGKTIALKGPTALGMLVQASKFTAALRPLSVTDHFLSEFGLGLCGIGGLEAHGMNSWYFKVNHRAPSVGAEAVNVKAGDEVLFGYGAYPYPDELALGAPARVEAGVPFTVRVFAYDAKGKKKPAAGATVTGASGPTDAQGKAQVTLVAPAKLVARLGKDTPSGSVPVCVGGRCPRK